MGGLTRNIEDLMNDPKGYLSMLADHLQNTALGRKAVINDKGAGYRNLTREEKLKQVQDTALDNIGGGGLGIIKSKGGNWLTGSVENALSRLKNPYVDKYATELERWGTPEKAREWVADPGDRARALNNWIEGPLTKYVKRDMATEGDPVRKLAERGVLHINPDPITTNVDSATYANRGATGFSPWGSAESDLAKSWENLSDRSIMSGFAGKMSDAAKAQNPWLEKLGAEDRVYQPSKIGHEGLGFNHLTDELANALNPESGLPRQLLLTPEQMQQMGMEKAVRHVHDINQWRAAQKVEANAKLAQSPAVHQVREYAENNPKGLRWVELKSLESRDTTKGHPLSGDAAYKHLQDQLKYEGDMMGHCVGGYCDRVADGSTRIFSLRDAKGEPHVTIETGRGTSDLPPSEAEHLPDRIVQIKGKQNLKPKDEYLPFVQDFVRNHPEGGKWGDIGDFHNTGLSKIGSKYVSPEELSIAFAKSKHPAGDIKNLDMRYYDMLTDGRPVTVPEDRAFLEALGFENLPDNQKFAEGGLVSGNWEPLSADGVTGYIMR